MKKRKFRFIYIPLAIILITLIAFAILPKGADLISPRGDQLLGSLTFHLLWISIVIDIVRAKKRKKQKTTT